MPNLGPLELGIIGLFIALAAAVGYWCLTIFRRKGRSPGAGFALGFLLTFFLSLVGAIVAVVVAYALSDLNARAAASIQSPPGPPRLLATFNGTSGWMGKTITHNGQIFLLEGYGPITARQVQAYDEKGQLDWAYDGLREWVSQLARLGPA